MKKGDNSSDNNWKMESNRKLKSKKTDELTFFNQYPLIKRLFYNIGLPGSAANNRLSLSYPIANDFK